MTQNTKVKLSKKIINDLNRDIDIIVSIHNQALPEDILPMFGEGFIKSFYIGAVRSDCGKLFGYYDDNEIIGFVLLAFYPNSILSSIIKKNFFHTIINGIYGILKKPTIIKIFFQEYFLNYLMAPSHKHFINISTPEIFFIAIDKNSRAKGFGSFIINDLKNYLRTLGYTKLLVKTKKHNNIDVINFYKKNGAKENNSFYSFGREYVYLEFELNIL